MDERAGGVGSNMGRSALRQTKAQGRVEWRWRRLIAASRPMSSGDEEVGLAS